MNPRDRSALEIDDALIRRLRIIDCPPDNEQLREMLAVTLPAGDPDGVLPALEALFDGCRAAHPDTFETEMPFGHGMFAGMRDTDDLALALEAKNQAPSSAPAPDAASFRRDHRVAVSMAEFTHLVWGAAHHCLDTRGSGG